MKKIEVIFRPEKLEPLKEKLLAAGVQGVTIYQVHGCGNQHGWIAYHRGNEVMMNTLPKVYLMTVVPDDRVEDFLQLIKETSIPELWATARSSFPPWTSVFVSGQMKPATRHFDRK